MDSRTEGIPQEHPPFRRRRKLIKPGLQLRLVASFALISGLGFVLQALLIAQQLAEQANIDPVLSSEVIPGLVSTALLQSFLCLLPLTIAVGILATFRLAGPVHRFEQHLASIARGEDTAPCQLRRGDELQELCERINEAVTALRRAHPGGREATRAWARTETAA